MIPHSTPEAIEQAIQEFHNKLATEESWQNWQNNSNYKFAIRYNNKLYPPKQIISMATGAPVSQFSGGEESNRYLENLGFTVMALPGEEKPLQGALEGILSMYLDEKESSFYVRRKQDGIEEINTVWSHFKHFEETVVDSGILKDYPHMKVSFSIGKGNWAKVPWITILDERHTTTTMEGVYIVYLFRGDMSGVYLTYNQGVTKARDKFGAVQACRLFENKAQEIRIQVPQLRSSGFALNSDIDLKSRGSLPTNYERSTIAHKFYEKGFVPDDKTLLEDLKALLVTYDEYVSQAVKSESGFKIDEELLTLALERVIRPALVEGDYLSDNKKEGYQHGQIIPKARPLLSSESINEDPVENTVEALKASQNLLSHFERTRAIDFLNSADRDEVGSYLSDLLYGNDELTQRAKRFLTWAQDSENKINPTVTSYLLSISAPDKYAFCKPTIYKEAARALLGIQTLPKGAERIAHTSQFYQETLRLLQEDPAIDNWDLMHVHIAFFLLQAGNGFPMWSELQQKPKTNEEGRKIWLIATGEGERYWNDFSANNYVGIDWNDLGDLNSYDSKEDLKDALDQLYPSDKEQIMNAHACFEFANKMSPGDLIFAKSGRRTILGLGEVASEYQFDEERQDNKHIHKVNWLTQGRWETENRKAFPADEDRPLNLPVKTLTDITPYKEMVDSLLRLVEYNNAPLEEALYTPETAVKDLFVDLDTFKNWLNLVKNKKNVILQGPPGTGKTFVSKRLAYAQIGIKAKDQIGMVQFHQSMTYEDFIQGFRPDDGSFVIRNGHFYTFCQRALDDPGNDYVFIIDEINRGNLSKIFGELMMLIEYDKRSPDYAIPLTYASEADPHFYVPPNLHLFGMMNTADRSLAMVDYALRRRFAFITLEPQFASPKFKQHLLQRGAPAKLAEKIIDRLGALNEKIADDTTNLGPGFCIGHSYFCPLESDEAPSEAWYQQVIQNEIGPLLHEYWFDNPDEANRLIQGLLD